MLIKKRFSFRATVTHRFVSLKFISDFFSGNRATMTSEKIRRIVKQLPKESILVESDGPMIKKETAHSHPV